MSLYLVRHGLAMNNTKKMHVGQMPGVGLDAAGLPDIRSTAEYLAGCGITGITTSPLERAFCTAAIIGGRLGLPVVPDARLAERGMGRLEGTGYAESHGRHGDTSLMFWSGDPALDRLGVESLADVRRRVGAAVRDAGDGTCLVAHAEIIKAVLLGMADFEPARIRALPCDNACVIRIGEGRWETVVSYGMKEYNPLRDDVRAPC